MLDLAIIVLLVIGFFVGLKRGFILQIFHLTVLLLHILSQIYTMKNWRQS